ncbi:tetratricopeptide repeat protein [Tunicatimonas pelagia]|uniref:tetratricopeptide repeat protein n=1 Tax=Tunicatimonas pelagia TaxID=931531 RepID=UPI00266668F4|nr:tetratricopeptide repeat protein [Tunicatimonas pelagia]WKN42154.1 tetratricopeptide repeat protein [Tunicatimonas pelagia]
MANRVRGSRSKKDVQQNLSTTEELLETPEALQDRIVDTEEYIKQHSTVFIIGAAIIVLAVAGYFGYQYYQTSQNQSAQEEMFQAIYYFESDSLNLALNGDGNNYGFLEIIDEFGGTDASNLAHYYAGVIELRQGNYESAIEYLDDFSASDLLVQAQAYALIGDAYLELGEHQSAASQYEKAADYNTNQFFSPQYLVKAAMAYEAAGDYAQAATRYQRIINKFPEAYEYQEAQKQRARLEALASN